MADADAADGSTVEGTIAFTDIVGFTEYTATRGDEEALQLLAVQERLARSVLPESARLVKELGDGLLLWFPRAGPALRSALDLQQRFEAESMETGLPMWMRVGMHHGRALTRGADLVGHDVNLAARIADVAGPGEVLVSDAVRLSAGEGATAAVVSFIELGPVVMKGIPEPVRLWRASAD
jgi:adenylate cyclase